MKQDLLTGRTLAVAGVLQAAQMVEETTYGARPAEDLFRASVHSLFAFRPRDAAEAYGGPHGVRGGLKLIIKTNERGWMQDQRTLRYAYDLMRVERKLAQYPEIQPVLRKRLEEIYNREDFSERSLASLCGDINIIYLDTLSKMDYRMRLQGEKKTLSKPEVQAQVRTLLMAGVRSVMLWRHLQGNIFRLFFQRQKMAAAAARLMRRMSEA